MTTKDASYHRAAIAYNEGLATFAGSLAEELEHDEVAKWCRSVSKQHKFHAGRHKKALDKMENKVNEDIAGGGGSADPEDATEQDNPTQAPVEPGVPSAQPVEDAPDPEQAAEPISEPAPNPEQADDPTDAGVETVKEEVHA